jgi:hypothetical protein
MDKTLLFVGLFRLSVVSTLSKQVLTTSIINPNIVIIAQSQIFVKFILQYCVLDLSPQITIRNKLIILQII